MEGDFVIDQTDDDGIRTAKVVIAGRASWIVAGPNGAPQLTSYGRLLDQVDTPDHIRSLLTWDFGLHLPWVGEHHSGIEYDDCAFMPDGRCIFFVNGAQGTELGEKAQRMTIDTPLDLAVFEVLRDFYDLLPRQ